MQTVPGGPLAAADAKSFATQFGTWAETPQSQGTLREACLAKVLDVGNEGAGEEGVYCGPGGPSAVHPLLRPRAVAHYALHGWPGRRTRRNASRKGV